MDETALSRSCAVGRAPVDGPSAEGEGEGEVPVGWVAALSSARAHMKRDRITVAAGSFAYRWFLSIFPVIIALLGVAAEVAIPTHVTVSLLHGVTRALPAGAATVFTGAIHHAEGRTHGAAVAIAVATAVALWSATSGMVMVEEGLDMAYEVPQDRSFVGKRLRAIPLLLASVVLGGGASALVVFGQAIGVAVDGSVPVVGGAFLVAWTIVRWTVALALVGLLLSLLYRFAPNRPATRFTWVSPGAVVATVAWAAISLAFSFYTSLSSSYSRTYGAFAGVAILIFWLYLTGLAILVGGEINAAFERQQTAVKPSQGAERAGRRRPRKSRH